jgi:hypothetical protein
MGTQGDHQDKRMGAADLDWYELSRSPQSAKRDVVAVLDQEVTAPWTRECSLGLA